MLLKQLLSFSLNAERAPQLKASVRLLSLNACMSKEYSNFAQSLNPVENRLFEILKIEKAEGELKIVLGTSEPRLFYTCVHFRGITDFAVHLFDDEDTGDLPQTFNSFDCAVTSEDKNVYEWILLGDESEWSFVAPFPEVCKL
jgi:hypothetical protein